jgi:hypothetical protein
VRVSRLLSSASFITAAGAAIRAAFAWNYQAHFSHRALAVIPFLFECGNISWSIATGHGFASPFHVDTGPTAWMTPVYPYVLAGLIKAFGTYTFATWVAAVALNICCSSLACVPLFYAGRRIGGPALAATAAWLWAMFPNSIQLTYESMWDTSLSALLGAALFWATLRVAESRSLRAWCGYGLLWGVALMTNAALLSLLPFLLGWAAWRLRAGWLPRAAAAAGIAALCCVPWAIRNAEVFHAFVPLRSVLGLQLWCGNNPQAKVIWLGGQHPIHDQAEREQYVQMGEIAYMQAKRRDAIAYMLRHPRRESELVAGRFVSFWTGGTPAPFADFPRLSPWFRYVLVFNLVVAASTAAGLLILWRRRELAAFPAASYAVVFPWAYYLTLSLPRYRAPIDPVLMLLTSVALLAPLRRLPGRARVK